MSSFPYEQHDRAPLNFDTLLILCVCVVSLLLLACIALVVGLGL